MYTQEDKLVRIILRNSLPPKTRIQSEALTELTIRVKILFEKITPELLSQAQKNKRTTITIEDVLTVLGKYHYI